MYFFYIDQASHIGGAENYLLEIATKLKIKNNDLYLVYGRLIDKYQIHERYIKLFNERIFSTNEATAISQVIEQVNDKTKINMTVVVHFGYENIQQLFIGTNVVVQ